MRARLYAGLLRLNAHSPELLGVGVSVANLLTSPAAQEIAAGYSRRR